jgi:hypothetical protein
MLLFRFDKNVTHWLVTDPNKHQVQHIECESHEKSWDSIRKEVSRRIRNAATSTATVEVQDRSR